MRFIGDTHGKFKEYENIVKDCAASIQVGDFGAGFRPIPDVGTKHRFIRGNHDNPALCLRHPNWIKDGTVEDEIFFLGGGFSTDRAERTEGLDYWKDEELSIPELYDAYDVYVATKPKIVVTHECPYGIAGDFFHNPTKRWLNPSRTSQALQSMWEVWKPKLWVFGHWHQPRDRLVDGTRVICLGELEFLDIDINSL